MGMAWLEMGAVGAWDGQAGVAGARVADHNHSALPHEGRCHSSYCREAKGKEKGRTTCMVRPLFVILQSYLSLYVKFAPKGIRIPVAAN
jgi:hypothetical protein